MARVSLLKGRADAVVLCTEVTRLAEGVSLPISFDGKVICS